MAENFNSGPKAPYNVGEAKEVTDMTLGLLPRAALTVSGDSDDGFADSSGASAALLFCCLFFSCSFLFCLFCSLRRRAAQRMSRAEDEPPVQGQRWQQGQRLRLASVEPEITSLVSSTLADNPRLVEENEAALLRNPAFLTLMRRVDDELGSDGKLYAETAAMARQARERARLQGAEGRGRGVDDAGVSAPFGGVSYDKVVSEVALAAASASAVFLLGLLPPYLAYSIISAGAGYIIAEIDSHQGTGERERDGEEFFDAEESNNSGGNIGGGGGGGGDGDGDGARPSPRAHARPRPRARARPSANKSLELAGKIFVRVIAALFIKRVARSLPGRGRDKRAKRRQREEEDTRRRSQPDAFGAFGDLSSRFQDSFDRRRLARQTAATAK